MKRQIVYLGLLIMLLPTVAAAQNLAADCIERFDQLLDNSGMTELIPENGDQSYTTGPGEPATGIIPNTATELDGSRFRCIGGGRPLVQLEDEGAGTYRIRFVAQWDGPNKQCVLRLENTLLGTPPFVPLVNDPPIFDPIPVRGARQLVQRRLVGLVNPARSAVRISRNRLRQSSLP